MQPLTISCRSLHFSGRAFTGTCPRFPAGRRPSFAALCRATASPIRRLVGNRHGHGLNIDIRRLVGNRNGHGLNIDGMADEPRRHLRVFNQAYALAPPEPCCCSGSAASAGRQFVRELWIPEYFWHRSINRPAQPSRDESEPWRPHRRYPGSQ